MLSRFLAFGCKVISSSTLTAFLTPHWAFSFFEQVNSTTEEAGFSRLIILVILSIFSFEVWRTRCFSLFLYSIDILLSLCARDNLHL